MFFQDDCVLQDSCVIILLNYCFNNADMPGVSMKTAKTQEGRGKKLDKQALRNAMDALQNNVKAKQKNFQEYSSKLHDPSDQIKAIVVNLLKKTYEQLVEYQQEIVALVPHCLSDMQLRAQAAKILIYIQKTLGDIALVLEDKKAAVFYYEDTFKQLKTNIQPLFESRDVLFETTVFEMFYAWQICNETSSTDLSFDTYEAAFNFAKKCSEQHIKLELYSLCLQRLIVLCNNKNIVRGWKAEFENLYTNIKAQYQKASSENTLTSALQLTFVQAELTRCDFNSKMLVLEGSIRGLDFTKLIKAQRKEALGSFFTVCMRNYRDFVVPAMDVLRNIRDLLAENHYYQWRLIGAQLLVVLIPNLIGMVEYYDSLSEKRDFAGKRAIARDISFLYSLISEFYTFFNKNVIGMSLPADILERSSRQVQAVINNEQKHITQRCREDKEKLDSCMQFEQELEEQKNKYSGKGKTLSPEAEIIEAEEPEDLPENILPIKEEENMASLFAQAAAFIARKKNKEALSQFIQIRFEAKGAGDIIHEMRAIDAAIHLLAQLLLEQIDYISNLLAKRIQEDTFIPENELAFLERLMEQASRKLAYLENIHEDLIQLSSEQNILSFTADVFTKIRIHSERLMGKYASFMEIKKQNIQAHYYRQGLTEVQEDERSHYSEADLIALGKARSNRLRLQREAGAAIPESGFSQENRLFKKLPDFLAGVYSQSQKLETAALHKGYKRVVLPQAIRDAFEFLNTLSQKHYLTGSTIIQLLTNAEFPAHDLDFISASVVKRNLISAHFREVLILPEGTLYTGSHSGQPIDILKVDDTENWLLRSLKKRDFTIAALSCDCFGNIMDPTDSGFSDLAARKLRMIGDPVTRLKESPVLVLRAMKYRMAKFKCEDQLEAALRSWKPSAETNFEHLHVLVAQYLNSKDAKKVNYLQCLNNYGLFKKIFPEIRHEGNWENTLARVESLLDKKKESRFGKHGIFPGPQNKAPETEKPVLPLAPSSLTRD